MIESLSGDGKMGNRLSDVMERTWMSIRETEPNTALEMTR